MAKKEITPANPDTNVTDEVEDDSITEAERKTAGVHMSRKSGRKTSGFHLI